MAQAKTGIYKATVSVLVRSVGQNGLEFARDTAIELLTDAVHSLEVSDLELSVPPKTFKEIVETALEVSNEGIGYPNVMHITESKLLRKHGGVFIHYELLDDIWGHVETLVERIQEGEITLDDI